MRGVLGLSRAMGTGLLLCLLAPAVSSAETLFVECEDLVGPWREQTNITGFSGRGFVVSNADGVAETSMAGRVRVEAAGTYHVFARGWEGAGADRRWRVQVGDTLLWVTHASRETTGWSWQRCGEVELTEGETGILALDAGDSYEVADAIVLTTDPNYDPVAEERRWLVLDPDEARAMVFEDIMERTRAAAACVPSPADAEGWRRRVAELRPSVLRALGLDPLPERTPINARLLGATQFDGYRIERLVFESRPGLLVPANVYVPDGEGPFPLVLNPVGHWTHAKAEPTPQARNHGLAKLGYITITYDPFGQGERNVPGNGHDEHWRLMLTGHCNMSIMVWDTVRALDYMLTRVDVDGSRIACTGASGGGLNTLYYSIVDERLDAAAPVVYITQWLDFLSTAAPHCPCSHVPGLGAITDMGEMIALFAPRPQLILDAADDPQFLTLGAQRAEQQARPIYDLLGAGDALELHTFPGDHDYGQGMREMLYGFLGRHLLMEGDGRPVTEPVFDTLPPDSDALRCFEGGRLPEDALTVHDLARGWAEDAIQVLPAPRAQDATTLRAELLALMGAPLDQEPMLRPTGTIEADGMAVHKLAVTTQQGIEAPVLYAPGDNTGPLALIVSASGDAVIARSLLAAAHERGLAAAVVTPRGHGETLFNEHVICTDNVLLGTPILGQRAFDIAQAARALRELPELGGRPVGAIALDEASGLYALFAQALWQPFDALTAGSVPASYLDAFDGGLPLAAYVNRILTVADIPHVAALASTRPLQVSWREPMGIEEAISWIRDVEYVE